MANKDGPTKMQAEGLVTLKKVSTSQIAVGNKSQLILDETVDVDLGEKLIHHVGKTFKVFFEESEPPEPEDEEIGEEENELADGLEIS